jgi:ABC-type branched-subunit amino acid transport system ATPase component
VNPTPPIASSPEFLVIDQGSRNFGGHQAVDRVSFAVAEGSLVALIGPNGAGKTTLLNLIAGTLPPSSGSIRFRGTPISSVAMACQLGIARTFQNVRLFPELSVLDNVMVAMGGAGFVPGFFPSLRQAQAERLRRKKALYLLEDMGVGRLANQTGAEAPFGQQRLVDLARAMAMQPRLLLLDEPAAGLNRTETQTLAALIRRIHERGVAVLLVEHNMSLVMELAERIIVLDRGQKIFDGLPAQARADARVCAVYLGPETEWDTDPTVVVGRQSPNESAEPNADHP